MLIAAHLASQNNTGKEIAEMMSVSPGTVSRWLKKCEEEGILKYSAVLDTKQLSDKEIEEIKLFNDTSDLFECIRALTPKGIGTCQPF